MSSPLPVFSTIGQAMAVFGLHFGKLIRWSLVPALLCLAALGAAFVLGVWFKPQGALSGFPYWWMGFVPAGLFCVIAWVPYAMRVNQLTVEGRVEPGGYVDKVLAPASLRYLSYAIVVGFIQLTGLLISSLPVVLAVWRNVQAVGTPRFILACCVSALLFFVFLILTSPMNLIYPAASVEAEPSLNRSYCMGAKTKFRLFLCMALSSILFAVLAQGVELTANHFGAVRAPVVRLFFFPVQILLGFFSYSTSLAVPAVAYRILSGLPEPDGGQAAASASIRPTGLVIPEPGRSAGEEDKPPPYGS